MSKQSQTNETEKKHAAKSMVLFALFCKSAQNGNGVQMLKSWQTAR